jgi:hypothetical protein
MSSSLQVAVGVQVFTAVVVELVGIVPSTSLALQHQLLTP